MHTEMFTKFGLVSSNVKPAILRHFYCSLTGDMSSANGSSEAEIDEQVMDIVSMEPEDSQMVFDLCEALTSHNVMKFDKFWEEAAKFIQEDIGAAANDKRHTTVTHLACQGNICLRFSGTSEGSSTRWYTYSKRGMSAVTANLERPEQACSIPSD